LSSNAQKLRNPILQVKVKRKRGGFYRLSSSVAGLQVKSQNFIRSVIVGGGPNVGYNPSWALPEKLEIKKGRKRKKGGKRKRNGGRKKRPKM
jgi:hypothetical protein